MCEPMVWVVDLDASLVDAPRTAERVLWYLMENGVLGRHGGGTSQLCGSADSCTPPCDTSRLDRPFDSTSDLQIYFERNVYTAGLERDLKQLAARCPACGTRHPKGSVQWGDALERWLERNSEDGVTCPSCAQRSSIAEWELADGEVVLSPLAYGFRNADVDPIVASEIAVASGHRVRELRRA